MPQSLPETLAALRDLALDLRWTWSHEADALWSHVDAELWSRTASPWAILHHVSPDQLEALAGDTEFLSELEQLLQVRRSYVERPAWYDTVRPHKDIGEVAYFSMEFGLGAALPLYAGGLGVLAGDFLKAASDLALPVVGVGLLYQEGYFRQILDAQGLQHEAYPYNEPDMLPIEPAMVHGAWLRIPLTLPGRVLQLRVWRATVGRARLYLLDSNDLLNTPSDRGVTGKLYVDDPETRLIQEAALGIGGWRALQALGHQPEVCHINEGHAAFAVVARACGLAAASGMDLRQALWATRPGNVFSTHTPVAAGFDRFAPELVRKYLAALEPALAEADPSFVRMLGLGRANSRDESEPFNMAYLAMRGSGTCCAVSRLHGHVSRRIFQPLFPRRPQQEVPVGHVTNGVHTPSWDSVEADRIWTEACGKDRWRLLTDDLPDQINSVPDEEIWTLRGRSRQRLIGYVRSRLAIQLRQRGSDPEAVKIADTVLDPNVLTLGVARRFTDYKRPTLPLHDPDRFARLLLNPQRPVQIVVAGKAHPADKQGKAMIQDWIAFAGEPSLRSRVVFIEDYDIAVAQELVQGVDVWINTPRRPSEACGTSGMKVLVNGGLNCSVRDGWWDEAYAADLGWSIGDGLNEDASIADAADADALYGLIERQIAPEFYGRGADGLPRAWIARIRRSMSALTAPFSAARMVRDYVEKAYLPAVSASRARSANAYASSRDLADWSARLARGWAGVHIAAPTTSLVGEEWRFAVSVFLGAITPEDVSVELYAEPRCEDEPAAISLSPDQAIAGSANGYVYAGAAKATRPAADFTVRVAPRRDRLMPTELPLVRWQG